MLPAYNAKIIAMIHDELLVQAPKRNAEEVLQVVGNAFIRAGKLKFSKIDMLFDGKVSDHWEK